MVEVTLVKRYTSSPMVPAWYLLFAATISALALEAFGNTAGQRTL